MCNKIIYFIAGIPDICTMKRKKYRYHKYEESFLELEIDHVSNMKACILDIERPNRKPKCTKIVNIYQSPTENHQYEKLINIKLIQII
jgi:hypothetical protein